MKMCHPQMETDPTSLLERVRQMEKAMKELLERGIRVEETTQKTVSKADAAPAQKGEKEILEERLPKAKAEELGFYPADRSHLSGCRQYDRTYGTAFEPAYRMHHCYLLFKCCQCTDQQ